MSLVMQSLRHLRSSLKMRPQDVENAAKLASMNVDKYI